MYFEDIEFDEWRDQVEKRSYEITKKPKAETDPEILKQIPAINSIGFLKVPYACSKCKRQLTVFEWRNSKCLKCENTVM